MCSRANLNRADKCVRLVAAGIARIDNEAATAGIERTNANRLRKMGQTPRGTASGAVSTNS